jgi:hypothetical protein
MLTDVLAYSLVDLQDSGQCYFQVAGVYQRLQYPHTEI